jgi:excisionase family DNA binding protein
MAPIRNAIADNITLAGRLSGARCSGAGLLRFGERAMDERNGNGKLANGTEELPDDLLTVKEAAKLLKPARGRRVHVSSVLRWVLQGRLQGYRRGHYWFVRRADVLALTQPVQVIQQPRMATARECQREQERVAAELKRRGY